jgi:hypothetical protein
MIGNSDATTFFNQFIDFVKNPPLNNKLELLEKHLIEYYSICINLNTRQGKMSKLNSDYDAIRLYISANFEEFGYYNDVLEIKDNLNETELVVGDAVDDLTDIVKDTLNALDLKKEKDVISSIKMDFEFHTKQHIINLLRYLTSDI